MTAAEVATYQDDHLFVDTEGFIVEVDGQTIALTATEYRLLNCLVANRGRLLTHRQILQSVWGFEYIDDVDYVRLYIWRLRHKIEPNPQKPQYITVVNGLGYRWSK